MGDGPEQVFAEITSGQPAVLDTAIDICSTTMRHLSDAIDLIGPATDMPEWDSSEAHEAYNLRAWATHAAAEVAFIRVNRTSLAVRQAAAAYDSAVESATDVIDWWRSTKRSDVSGDVLSLARTIASLQLYAVRIALNGRLAEALDFLQTDPLSGDEKKWRTTGLIKSMLHDLSSPTDQGPTIPNTLATDDDGGWTPQGLGYDPDGDPPALLQTSYSGDKAQLVRIDPETGEQLGFVDLGGHGSGNPPDHAGGVTVHGNRVDVMSSDKPPRMFTYDLDAIREASPGQTVSPEREPQDMLAGAYSTIDGDTLYVGTFEEDKPGELFVYTWDDDRRRWASQPGSYATPPKTQGAAVIDGQMVFSTSHGRGNPSELRAYRLADVLGGHGNDDDFSLGEVTLPTMSEGVVAMDGKGLISTYESGAAGYSKPTDDVKLEDLWASQSMTITPFSALGMTGGIDVVPVTLDKASVEFDAGGRRLQRAGSSIDEVALPPGCLGGNAQGDTFAKFVTSYCDLTSEWISQGRISAAVTADGLVTSAQSYVDADQMIRSLFETLNFRMGGS
ncbi:hypothetical protein GEV27_05685 [Aeromicrobium sp. S22]|uniref:hypothetical protein n=1 Tax=Aeromicrobium sp. S22 TaxID=2662029 RepID=UPI00129E5C48|nr:hypothetical protein [Aeromicrobium sp. S22]MRK01008.1 hypothetical protein [Aeromicrobium sp. S22]